MSGRKEDSSSSSSVGGAAAAASYSSGLVSGEINHSEGYIRANNTRQAIVNRARKPSFDGSQFKYGLVDPSSRGAVSAAAAAKAISAAHNLCAPSHASEDSPPSVDGGTAPPTSSTKSGTSSPCGSGAATVSATGARQRKGSVVHPIGKTSGALDQDVVSGFQQRYRQHVEQQRERSQTSRKDGLREAFSSSSPAPTSPSKAISATAAAAASAASSAESEMRDSGTLSTNHTGSTLSVNGHTSSLPSSTTKSTAASPMKTTASMETKGTTSDGMSAMVSTARPGTGEGGCNGSGSGTAIGNSSGNGSDTGNHDLSLGLGAGTTSSSTGSDDCGVEELDPRLISSIAALRVGSGGNELRSAALEYFLDLPEIPELRTLESLVDEDQLYLVNEKLKFCCVLFRFDRCPLVGSGAGVRGSESVGVRAIEGGMDGAVGGRDMDGRSVGTSFGVGSANHNSVRVGRGASLNLSTHERPRSSISASRSRLDEQGKLSKQQTLIEIQQWLSKIVSASNGCSLGERKRVYNNMKTTDEFRNLWKTFRLLLRSNLVRSLPPLQEGEKYDPFEDDPPKDPAWMHLEGSYNVAHSLLCCDFLVTDVSLIPAGSWRSKPQFCEGAMKAFDSSFARGLLDNFRVRGRRNEAGGLRHG